jgi:hypothetical protein
MSTQTDQLPAVHTPHPPRVGPAVAIFLGLLVIGLAIGLNIGWLQAGPDSQQASPAVAAPAPKAPELTWRDDYATRHPQVAAEAPVLTWRDDYATRHPGERP